MLRRRLQEHFSHLGARRVQAADSEQQGSLIRARRSVRDATESRICGKTQDERPEMSVHSQRERQRDDIARAELKWLGPDPLPDARLDKVFSEAFSAERCQS